VSLNAAATLGIAAAALLTGAAAVLADDANTIVQNGRAFHPTEITIAAGTTLDFSNQDDFLHQIYVDTEGFNYDSAEQQPGEVFHITFPNAGTFPVRCHIHPKMLLTVHVK
jgi:plastocyanin